MMQHISPIKTALATALIISIVVSGIIFLMYFFFFENIGWAIIGVSILVSFAITSILFHITLRKYVDDRIQLIYKIIYSLKGPVGQKNLNIPGRVDLIYQTSRDVQEWADQKAKELEDLQKLETYRREFLGNVSHELKTPIFNIQGYVLTLLDGAIEDPKINRQYLLRAEQSINRMIGIVEDLEAISRLESGQLQLKIALHDLVEIAKEVVEFSELKAKSKNIRIVFSKNYDNPIWVECDKQRIQQVFTNLLVNSILYGNMNGETRIGFFDMGENILVDISDDGIGISREDLPRIFDRFFRGDKSRTYKEGNTGSGLGLTIVKHIIEAHKQSISVKSTPALGTTFSFTLKKGKPQGLW